MKKAQSVMVLVLLAAVCLSVFAPPAPAAQESSQQAVNAAARFMETEGRGQEILSFVHFGADYRGYDYLRTESVVDARGNRIDGEFALVYRFKWENDGVTDLAFLCHPNGQIYQVNVEWTNALLSQPFALANLSIKVLGNYLISQNKNNMSDFQFRLVKKLVDDADAKGLLEFSLALQQAVGK
jgi:hypothetical protein